MNTVEIAHLLREVRSLQQQIDLRLALIEATLPGSDLTGQIIAEACSIWGCRPRLITNPPSARSGASATDCRRAICKMMRDLHPDMDTGEIATRTGRGHKTTVLHHIRKANELLELNDPDFTRKFNQLKEKLGL